MCIYLSFSPLFFPLSFSFCLHFSSNNLFFTHLPLSSLQDSSTSHLLHLNRLLKGHLYLASAGNVLIDVLHLLSYEVSVVIKALFTNVCSVIERLWIDKKEGSPSACTSTGLMSPLHRSTMELMLRLGLELSSEVSV